MIEKKVGHFQENQIYLITEESWSEMVLSILVKVSSL